MDCEIHSIGKSMNSKRYAMLDILRGLTLISMIAYHTVWDMVYIFDVEWAWYKSDMAYVWQQSICWSFILLSGFCWSFGKVKWKRALTVFLAGIVITVVTLLVMPEERIVFGVLTFLGSAMFLMIPLDKIFSKGKPWVGFFVSFLLFLLFKNINEGYLGLEKMKLIELPESWYHGWTATYLGFTEGSFFSTDYFSVLPWIFLFNAGYFLYGIFRKQQWFAFLEKGKCTVLENLGKNSLWIYMLHQPIAYGVLWVFFRLVRVF